MRNEQKGYNILLCRFQAEKSGRTGRRVKEKLLQAFRYAYCMQHTDGFLL